MHFVRGGLECAFGESRAGRRRGEQFYGVDACIEELLRCCGSLCGVGDFWSSELHHAHEPENLVRGKSVRRDETFTGGANFRAGDFAGVDAIAKASGVFPHGAGVEHAGEAVASEHVLKLASKLGRRNVCHIGPLALEEVNMAVPKSGGDGESKTIEDVSGFWELHLRAAAYRDNLFVLDEHNSVAYGFVVRANINRGAHERGALVR